MISFPFWMSKPGQLDALITDVGGYNAAIAMGYTVGTITPTDPTPSGSPVVVQTSVNPQQPDPNQPSC